MPRYASIEAVADADVAGDPAHRPRLPSSRRGLRLGQRQRQDSGRGDLDQAHRPALRRPFSSRIRGRAVAVAAERHPLRPIPEHRRVTPLRLGMVRPPELARHTQRSWDAPAGRLPARDPSSHRSHASSRPGPMPIDPSQALCLADRALLRPDAARTTGAPAWCGIRHFLFRSTIGSYRDQLQKTLVLTAMCTETQTDAAGTTSPHAASVSARTASGLTRAEPTRLRAWNATIVRLATV